jgi:hypothetical protein
MKHPRKAAAPPQKGEARTTAPTVPGLNSNQQQRNSSRQPTKDKPTAAGSTAAQRIKLLALLKARPQTTYALRQHGISHPAARVQELIRLDVPISSGRCTCVDGDGFLHRNVAIYTLTAKPQPDLFEGNQV